MKYRCASDGSASDGIIIFTTIIIYTATPTLTPTATSTPTNRPTRGFATPTRILSYRHHALNLHALSTEWDVLFAAVWL